MTVTVKIEVEKDVRERAAKNLERSGLTVTEALRLLLVQVASGREIDLDPIVPNRDTVDAIEAARKGDLVPLGTPAAAIEELNLSD